MYVCALISQISVYKSQYKKTHAHTHARESRDSAHSHMLSLLSLLALPSSKSTSLLSHVSTQHWHVACHRFQIPSSVSALGAAAAATKSVSEHVADIAADHNSEASSSSSSSSSHVGAAYSIENSEHIGSGQKGLEVSLTELAAVSFQQVLRRSVKRKSVNIKSTKSYVLPHLPPGEKRLMRFQKTYGRFPYEASASQSK